MICSPQSDKASSACFLHLQRRAGMALRVAGYHCCCSCCGQPLCSASLLSSSSSPPADKPEWFLPGEPVTVAAAEQGAEVWAQGGGQASSTACHCSAAAAASLEPHQRDPFPFMWDFNKHAERTIAFTKVNGYLDFFSSSALLGSVFFFAAVGVD